ncbi:hypothetical protein [Clostridium saccharobutylicum]|uniref:Uncharacterized protein n=1 Tax=Clostridium saccharobutylicum DSM 13864 TaxID=1345695 RepID=U5MTK2_CLOSA|nr:hypothetical protein [Clostridium saccharobutylicum]AGX43890.1 hypothetical protein CLSA_c29230 [Clostridium saccharobutylicum DSM 13864]AQR91188.1 hypothetical protein CLOSC_29120 [Clostridium saccharobutylicum]AQS01092.1 hypothetical protein CSACC_29190 [Clostridium saccharobutylicum]AQS15075.1 hypothetical protein CLOSACC_29190 [Clostridium saccharobutylicum]MBA2905200.1 hypothetical protein [Clostridium saccharobutylicum]
MSRADTVNQKIMKNIKYLFRKSEILAKAYPGNIGFYYMNKNIGISI